MIGLLWGLVLSLQAQERYFPPAFAEPSFVCDEPAGMSGKFEIVSDFENDWYSQHLLAAREPSLYAASLRRHPEWQETVRFTWLRSFHAPIVIRIETRSNGTRLIAKQLSGQGGYAPGKIEKMAGRTLTKAETARLVPRKSAALAEAPSECGLGADGAVWIVEGVDAKGYRFVKRWSPEKGNVRALGEYLLGLTGWQLGEIY